MENHHFWWENSLFLWPFSIAMLVYQRVMTAGHVAKRFPDSVSAFCSNQKDVDGHGRDRTWQDYFLLHHLQFQCVLNSIVLGFHTGEIKISPWKWTTVYQVYQFIKISDLSIYQDYQSIKIYQWSSSVYPAISFHWRMMHDWMGSWRQRRPRRCAWFLQYISALFCCKNCKILEIYDINIYFTETYWTLLWKFQIPIEVVWNTHEPYKTSPTVFQQEFLAATSGDFIMAGWCLGS